MTINTQTCDKLKVAGCKPSGEADTQSDTGRLAPFRFYANARCVAAGAWHLDP
jgi:hypothetical protein